MDHSSWITDEQFSDENIFHTRLFPSDFGFIWCFTYDPPDTSPSGGEGKVRFEEIHEQTLSVDRPSDVKCVKRHVL